MVKMKTTYKKGKPMKLILTEAQAYLVKNALEWAQNPDFPESDEINLKYQRIIDKIEKEL